jgi:hypothetical protein
MFNKIKSLARFFSRAKPIDGPLFENTTEPGVAELGLNFKNWDHRPSRVPQLDLLDLKTIVWLVDNYGERDIPIHSKRLMKKINESMSVYEWEKELIKNHENNN